ncbi:MAG TPA: S41 family peptidase [Terriglobia bacterium]|nr:S41 family peptidase [Terriglobia bacterium]
MIKTRRLVFYVGSTIMLCTVLGGLYGQQVEATTSDTDDSDVQKSIGTFAKLLDVVEQNYADPVDSDKAIFGVASNSLGAIPGMLRTLDPHSSFLDPETFEKFQEDQEGKYYGVGMTIVQLPGKLGKMVTTVVEPNPGSPAFRAGLRPGDVIISVDKKSTENLDVPAVASLLKGPKGTTVNIEVTREGSDQPIDFDVTRDEIGGRGVDAAFLFSPGLAYIHVATFNEKTNDELVQALKKVNENDLQGMILDLRDNRGGLLQEAVDVADHFLEKDQLIVSHHGRNSPEKRWKALDGNHGNEYPMVVLINRYSASAAEIVAGALQDHDRALVMGEPSFGKGLVQSEYPLSEKAFLLLTTARYYTPSGRLIQRNYQDVSLYDYLYDRDTTLSPHTEVKHTDGGREVFGGGGITPDVQFTDPKMTATEDLLTQQPVFFDFGKHYLATHKTIAKDFTATPEVVQEFKDFLVGEKIQVSEQDFDANLAFIKNRIRAQLVAVIFGENEALKIERQNDPLVAAAARSMGQAAQLLANAKKYMAGRNQAKAMARP